MATSRLVTCAKLSLRLLGGLVCALFAAQAIFIFVNPNIDNFWDGCHWLGQGLLGLGVGAIGIYLEVRGSMASVTKQCARFLLNRIGLSLFYFWMGCYVMGGGVINSSLLWQALARFTGITAWVVSGGDLLISCCAEAPDEQENGLVDEAQTSQAAKPASASQYGRSNSGFDLGGRPNEQPQFNSYPGNGAGGSHSNPSNHSPFDGEDDLGEIKLTEEPGGGAPAAGGFQWNTGMSKPFGTS